MKDKEYVVAIGANAIDEYYSCEAWPKLGNKAIVKFLEKKVGGMIPNAAAILASYGLATCLLDTLGGDSDTEIILDELRKYKVDTEYINIDNSIQNTKTLIMLSENERTIFVVDNGRTSIEIDEKRMRLLLNAGYIYTIISDVKKIKDNMQLLSKLKENGCNIVYDVESTSFSMPEDEEYFLNASILFFNEEGFERFKNGSSKNEAIEKLFSSGVKVIVITLGGNGCEVWTEDKAIKVDGICVNAVDTTGAGDTFNGSFLYFYSLGWSLEKCAKYANAAAARSIMFFGPKSGITSVDKIESFAVQNSID